MATIPVLSRKMILKSLYLFVGLNDLIGPRHANTAAHQEPCLCCTDSAAVKEPKEYGARYPS